MDPGGRARRAADLSNGRVVAFWLLLALADAAPSNAQRRPENLQFDSEQILIEVQGDFDEVTGTYHFRVLETPSAATSLLYPYPQDPLLGAARTLRLEVLDASGSWASAGFTEAPPRGVSWRLPASESNQLAVRTTYRQRMRSSYARYIVKTTHSWGRPLRRASFEIRLPSDARDPTFSYPFRRKGPSEVVWVYEVEDFLPEEDIWVRFRR